MFSDDNQLATIPGALRARFGPGWGNEAMVPQRGDAFSPSRPRM